MAKSTSLPQHQGHNVSGQTFTSADTTAKKDIFTPGANDSDCTFIAFCSNDTAAVNLSLWYYDGSTAFLIGTVRGVTLVGTDGVANAIDALNSTAFPHLPVNDAGKRYIPVKAGHKLQASCVATMTAAKTVTVVAGGHDF